jgi:hypothetical protein
MSSSARIPFIPRPASRAAHLKDQQQNSATPKAHQQTFFADVANPLHSSSNMQSSSVTSQPKSQTGENARPPAAVSDKPLNTGGLLKKKKTQMGVTQNPSLSRRPSFPGSDVITRPGTADPHSNAHQNQSQTLKIAAPVPRQPARPSSPTLSNSLAAGVFSFAPLTPKNCLPAPSQPQPIPESTHRPKDTHTPAVSGLGFNFSKTHTVTEQHQNTSQQLPSPPDTIRTSSTSAFESLSTLEPDRQASIQPFTLNMSLPNQTGPQRVIFDSEGTRSGSDNLLLDQSLDPDDTRHGRRRTNNDQQLKRPRTELHDDQNQDISDDHDTSSHPKRYKNHTVRVRFYRYTETQHISSLIRLG